MRYCSSSGSAKRGEGGKGVDVEEIASAVPIFGCMEKYWVLQEDSGLLWSDGKIEWKCDIFDWGLLLLPTLMRVYSGRDNKMTR